MLLHVAAFVIPFILICNMTTLRIKNVFTFDPTKAVECVSKDRICTLVSAFVISYNLI